MAHTGRNIVMGLIGAGIVGGLLFVTFRPEPIPVDLHEIARGDFEITFDVDGKTRVAELYEVSAPISGIAQRSPVRVGDRVTGGQTVVARVEPLSPGLLDARTRLQAEAALSEAEAMLNVAETEASRAAEDEIYARQQYDRTQQLVERGVVSITRMEDAAQRLTMAEAALDAARARIDQATSGVERARAAMIETTGVPEVAACCVPIMAPADGVVLDIDQISAGPVGAGQRLLTIGDPSEIELVADLLSSDAVRLPPGAVARVERWGGPVLEARLTRVEPAGRTKVSALGIEEQRVDAVFDLVTPPGEGHELGHAFAVYLRVVAHAENDVVLVPLSAAFRTETGWAVFKVEDDRARRVPVELGRNNSRMAVVLSGLAEGDMVIVHPREDLSDGALIAERTAF